MSWLNDLASFAKKLLMLESRVETNAKEIKALRQDVKALTIFTQKVAYAVKRNEERRKNQSDILVRDLKIELLKLEGRLSKDSAPLHTLNAYQKQAATEDKLLSDGDGRVT